MRLIQLFIPNKPTLLKCSCLLFSLLLSACASKQTTQFYMLNAKPANEANTVVPEFNRNLQIGLGPIHLPEYLNRPQLVVEVSENQYQLDDQHRWAEGLDQNISRSLTQLLTTRLGVEQIRRYPWATRQAPDYQISIDILQFHQLADGNNRLQAQWTLKHQDQVVMAKQFECSIASPVAADAMVKAQSLCLSRLGLEIESGLRDWVSGHEN